MLSADSPSHDSQTTQKGLPPFELLYDRYHERVYRYLYAHLKHEYDAADLTQQVFFQAWKQGETYEARRGSVATWLMSIAHHRLVDFYRLSRPSLSWETLPDVGTKDQSPEAKVLSEETFAGVRKLLEALTPEERELLALRFAAQLSSTEIAPLIGKSAAATKKQLTRLLHRLQEEHRRLDLEDILPALLEPSLPELAAAILQIYTAPLPEAQLQDIRQGLLQQISTL